MIEQLQTILNSIVAAFLHVWPYLLVTIPLAVIVQMSGASRYINRAFRGRPLVAVGAVGFDGGRAVPRGQLIVSGCTLNSGPLNRPLFFSCETH